MSAATYPVYIEQGASFAVQGVFSNMNLSGMTGYGVIRQTANDPNILATFTVIVTNVYGTIVAPVNGVQTTVTGGIFTFSLTPAQTLAIPPLGNGSNWQSGPTYTYDISFNSAYDGTVYRVLNGPCYVSPGVTLK
jgi:hypothetical protein